MVFQDRFKILRKETKQREEEEKENAMQEIRRNNQVIEQVKDDIEEVCKEFSKTLGFKLNIHDWKYDTPYKNVKRRRYSASLKRVSTEFGELCIYVECDGKKVSIEHCGEYGSRSFANMTIPIGEHLKEKLAESLEMAYKQMMGLVKPEEHTPQIAPQIANWRELITLKNGEYIVEYFNLDPSLLTFLPVLTFAFLDTAFVLTNKRLIVLSIKSSEEKEGNLTISFDIKQEFLLENIKDVAYENYGTVVYTNEGKYDFGPKSQILNSGSGPDHKFSAQIGWGHSYFKKKIIEQKEAKATVTVDFSFLRSIMEKGGIVLTTLTCPKCNASIRLPPDGTETVCQYCGSTVYAQDIFKKLKSLLS